MFKPLVSIVIPVYNGSNYLAEAIESALGQTYENLEVVVVNDGSTDQTEDVALSFGSRIRYCKKDNGGVATALNMAIRLAEGQYISWLSHDDLYAEDKIRLQVEQLESLGNKNTLIYSDFTYINGKSETIGAECIGSRHDPRRLNSSLYPLLSGIIHGCTLMISKALYLKYGLFDESLKTTQDYDLWFKMLRENPISFIDKPLVMSRSHDGQSSKTMKNLHRQEASDLWNKILAGLSSADIGVLCDDGPGFLFSLYNRLWAAGLPTPARTALLKAVGTTNRSENVLILTAMRDGGLGRFVNDLSRGLGQAKNIYTLAVSGRQFRLFYKETMVFDVLLSRRVLLEEMYTDLEVSSLVVMIVHLFRIGLVHINGFFCLGFTFVDALHSLGLPLVLTVHDFHLACFSQFLLDNDSRYCAINKDLDICSRCLERNRYADWLGPKTAKDLLQYREFVQGRVLPHIDRIVFPSDFSREVLCEFYPNLATNKLVKIEHGIPSSDHGSAGQVKRHEDGRLRVGIVGDLRAHKGLKAVKAISERASKESVRLFLFGKCELPLPGVVTIPFASFEQMVPDLIKADLDIALVLSEAPETFSYALSECWSAGLPVIVTDVGALKERMDASRAGFIVDRENTAEQVLNLLDAFLRQPGLLEEARRNVRKIRQQSDVDMADEYLKVYSELLSIPRAGIDEEWVLSKLGDSLVRFLQQRESERINAAHEMAIVSNRPRSLFALAKKGIRKIARMMS